LADPADHPNARRTVEYLDDFAAGDLAALENYYSDDVVWHVGGTHRLSRDYHGRSELFDYFDQVKKMTGGTLTLRAESVLASDEHVALFLRASGKRAGRRLDAVMVEAITVAPDGRWSEVWSMADDQSAVDEFWS
jgi:ketosteroid isomerase-like protein